MNELEVILDSLNAVLVVLEDFSETHDGFSDEEIAAIRENLESIKDNVWRLTN